MTARTVRRYLREWVRLGLVERADVHPGPRYRLDPDAGSRTWTCVARIREAAGRFGGEDVVGKTVTRGPSE